MSELEKNMSLDDRINNLIKNVEQHKDVLYEDEEDQISEEEIKRIENAYRSLNRKLAATERNRWNYSQKGYMNKRLISKHLNSMKNGLFSVFPIPCKQQGCPYGDTCIALQNNMQPPIGEPCILEVNKIENLIIGYSSDFNIDSASTSDKVFIQELIQLDLLMDRCQILMSRDVDILQDVTMGVTEDGEVYTQPVVSRYLEAWERMSKRRQSILNEMMATRHSRKGMKKDELNDEDMLMKIISDAHFGEVEARPDKFKDE